MIIKICIDFSASSLCDCASLLQLVRRRHCVNWTRCWFF